MESGINTPLTVALRRIALYEAEILHLVVQNAENPSVRDSNLFKRRSGKLYVEIQVNLFKKMYKAGYITYSQYLKSSAIRVCSASAPNWLRQFMFKKVLRK